MKMWAVIKFTKLSHWDSKICSLARFPWVSICYILLRKLLRNVTVLELVCLTSKGLMISKVWNDGHCSMTWPWPCEICLEVITTFCNVKSGTIPLFSLLSMLDNITDLFSWTHIGMSVVLSQYSLIVYHTGMRHCSRQY